MYGLADPGIRFRVKDERDSHEDFLLYLYRSGLPTGQTYPLSVDLYDRTEMHDTEVPQFYKRSRQGELFNNPADVHVITEYHEPCEGKSWWFGGTDWWEGEWPVKGITLWTPSPEYLGVDTSGIQDQITSVVTEAFAKVDSAEFDALVFFGEFSETKELFLTVGKRLRRMAFLLKRDKRTLRQAIIDGFKKGYSPASTLNWWMEYRYGWRLLYKDIQDLIKLWKKLSEGKVPPFRKSFRKKGIFDVNLSDTVHVINGYYDAEWERKCYGTLDVKAGCLAQVRPFAVPDYLGLTKIPSAIWDLTRLSWVVDIFVNVADTIASWQLDPYWERLFGWATVYHNLTYENKLKSVVSSNSSVGMDITNYGSQKITDVGWTRIPFDASNLPTVPVLSSRLDWAKTIDLSAVLTQNTKPTLRKVSKFLETWEPGIRKVR